MNTVGTRQRMLLTGAVLEAIGILALATRFGADKGGTALLAIGAVSLVVGIVLQIRAVLSAPTL